MVKPANVQAVLRELEPAGRVAATIRSDPNVWLRPGQAAILMGFSERTLQSWRESGTGPAYWQGGGRVEMGQARPVGTNQHVRYKAQDISDFFENGKVWSTKQAAAAKCQTFVNTVADLAEEAPFYVDAQGQVESLVEDGTLATLLECGEWAIVWLPVSDAASRKWSSLDKHRPFAEKVRRVLSNAQQSVDAGLEATELAEAVREAPVGETKHP